MTDNSTRIELLEKAVSERKLSGQTLKQALQTLNALKKERSVLATLNKGSRAVYQWLKKSSIEDNFTKYQIAQDVEHVDFIVKSQYMLGVISTKLKFINIEGFLFAVNKKNLLFEVATKRIEYGYQTYLIKDQAFQKIIAEQQ